MEAFVRDVMGDAGDEVAGAKHLKMRVKALPKWGKIRAACTIMKPHWPKALTLNCDSGRYDVSDRIGAQRFWEN